ncbi:MAG: hypothetical protein EAZ42_08110 [Verrucomicrobia bacterium]|nr:MAG: hypothetical protein EAZ42_08110 [Verrucomicrobiota bacterium]
MHGRYFILVIIAILAGCAPVPLSQASLPAAQASRLTPAKPLTESKQKLIVGKWELMDGTMEFMRGGHFRLRGNDGSILDSTGRPPQGASGAQRGKVLPGSARWEFIESPEGDHLRINIVMQNPHGYANPSMGGALIYQPSPQYASLDIEIHFVNDHCIICRRFGSLSVGRRVR